jgi:transcriptional regulator with AAA-type ATPase domain
MAQLDCDPDVDRKRRDPLRGGAVTSDSTATTVTGASASPRDGDAGEQFLVWLFPLTGRMPVSLAWPDEGDLIIGRDAECAVCLSGSDVSRRHAALRRVGSQARTAIVDLGSRNGVRVNGRPVSSVELGTGDIVRVGGWVGVVSAVPGEFGEIAPGLWGGGTLAAALASLQKAAASDLPIILEGETGTGKEVVTRVLHRWSGRPGPLVAVNCAALPEGLAEGELFGYRRGAFTGADRSSTGLFRSAEGGTLLLDEVADLPLPLQAKLLRVLEQKEVQPLGETRPVSIDVRIVVACQQPLMHEVRAGRFRADLVARLDGLTVHLPPLRQRKQDILPLFCRLLGEVGHGRCPSVDSAFVERLCLHDWPFNVRELVLLARRLWTLHGSEPALLARHLPERIGQQSAASDRRGDETPSSNSAALVAEAALPVDLPALMVALRASGGNVARASAMLGITRQRAYRLMEGQGVNIESLRKQDDSRG